MKTHGRELKPTHRASNLLTAARWVLRHAAPAAILLALWLRPAAAASSTRLRISSQTVSSPDQLVHGVLPLSAAEAKVPWRPPEYLEYEVKWGIMDVGVSNLQAKEVVDFNGAPALHIVSEAHSIPFFDHIYKVRDLNESWMDASTLESYGYSKKLREGGFFRDEWVLYDYHDKGFLAKTINRDGSFHYSTGTIPGQVQDILSSLYLLRSKDLKVGAEIVLDVNTKQNWPLVVKVLRKQHLDVPAGSFDTIEVEPFLRNEGIFVQKGKRLQVWMTDDERKIPVMMSVEIGFGNITAALRKIGT